MVRCEWNLDSGLVLARLRSSSMIVGIRLYLISLPCSCYLLIWNIVICKIKNKLNLFSWVGKKGFSTHPGTFWLNDPNKHRNDPVSPYLLPNPIWNTTEILVVYNAWRYHLSTIFFPIFSSQGESKSVNINDLNIHRKRVRPCNKQGEFESRRLWQHVTNALKVGDVNTATAHKKLVSYFPSI